MSDNELARGCGINFGTCDKNSMGQPYFEIEQLDRSIKDEKQWDGLEILNIFYLDVDGALIPD